LAEDHRTRIYTVIAGSTIALEYLFRPWDGGAVGQFLLPWWERTRQFAGDYGKERDMALTCLAELPLWLFVCYWWGKLLIELENRTVRTAGGADGSLTQT